MGSFNEVCALSRLNIGYGTPVKVLFLTKNPYTESDQHEAERGVNHNTQWFVRTPPITGIYADYGKCDFKENNITDSIVRCFQGDVVERPFGFNRYHAKDVTKTKGIHHFLEAAWQGRLLVSIDRNKEQQDVGITWQKVHALLKEAKLPLQLEDGEGYNAQEIIPGVIAITSTCEVKYFLKKTQRALKEYDTRFVFKFGSDQREPCLIVTFKDGFNDVSKINSLNEPAIKKALFNHPERELSRNGISKLPTLAVMIRQDVWNVYCNVNHRNEKIKSVSSILADLKKFKASFYKIREESDVIQKIFKATNATGNSFFFTEPLCTSVFEHLYSALTTDSADKDFLQVCAECSRIEMVLARLHQSWHIPSLGGQDGAWGLQTNLLTDLLKISQKEKRKRA